MFIWGRLLGSIIGFASSGPFGLFIGFFLGLLFDRSVSGVIKENLRQPGQTAETKEIFMQLLFTALGDIAKADGRVSEVEVSHTEKIIKDFNLTGEARQQAISWFKKGAEDSNNYDDLLKHFSLIARRRSDLKRVLLETLISLAMSDGDLDVSEEKKLLYIASKLGIPSFVFQKMLDILKGQYQFRQGAPVRSHKGQLSDAYKALGISEDVNEKELKRAYRKLISENHPDKLIAKGVPEDVLKVATEKSQAIQSAYDLIKKHRKSV